MKFFSARTEDSYLTAKYRAGDFLVFGSETKGLGREFIDAESGTDLYYPDFRTRGAKPESFECGFDRGLRGAAPDRRDHIATLCGNNLLLGD